MQLSFVQGAFHLTTAREHHHIAKIAIEAQRNDRAKMSGKYAFSQTLKEVRFLFCQTAEQSGPTR